jgi:hypothetical protein
VLEGPAQRGCYRVKIILRDASWSVMGVRCWLCGMGGASGRSPTFKKCSEFLGLIFSPMNR